MATRASVNLRRSRCIGFKQYRTQALYDLISAVRGPDDDKFAAMRIKEEITGRIRVILFGRECHKIDGTTTPEPLAELVLHDLDFAAINNHYREHLLAAVMASKHHWIWGGPVTVEKLIAAIEEGITDD